MSISAQDRELFRDSVRGLLAAKWSAERAPSLLADAGALPSVWRDLCEQSAAALGADAEQGAAMSKVFFGELMERALECAIDMLGASATMSEEAPEVALRGRIEQALRTSIMMVVGGGAAEIQRTLIAQHGIGLPRPDTRG